VKLSTGAELRVTGPVSQCAVVCLNGGRSREVEGTWSASVEWLVRSLAPRMPELGFAEVRYRVRSWRRFESCVEDARSAVEEVGAPRVVLLGFSMGGAVSIAIADEPAVHEVIGLAPWIPDELDVTTLRRKRLAVFHGALDRWLPGIPGVSASHSRKGFDRARERGADGRYVLIPGGLHGIALRSPWGTLVPLPKAERWVELVEEELTRFAQIGNPQPQIADRARVEGAPSEGR
jgi:dienelactone hydrolase